MPQRRLSRIGLNSRIDRPHLGAKALPVTSVGIYAWASMTKSGRSLPRSRADWLAAMSGAFSVPFAAVSVFADQKYQPLIWAILAFLALTNAAFRLWRTQHLRVQALEVQIAGQDGFRRNIDVGEAIAFFSLGIWGKRFGDAAATRPSVNEAVATFVQGAADGDFPVWGKGAQGTFGSRSQRSIGCPMKLVGGVYWRGGLVRSAARHLSSTSMHCWSWP